MMNAVELLALSHQTSIVMGMFAGLVVTLVTVYIVHGVKKAEAELIKEYNDKVDKYNRRNNIPQVTAGFIKNYKAEVKGLSHD